MWIGPDGNEKKEGHVIVEIHKNLAERYGYVFTTTLVDAPKNTIVKVFIFKPSCHFAKL